MTGLQAPSSTRSPRKIYLDQSYLENNPTWHVEDSLWKAQQIQKMLAKHSITPKTVGEVGCGAGEILKQLSLLHSTTQFAGYELSPQAMEMCKVRESERVRFYMENLLEKEERFDVALCIDVFEHVEDYMGFLKLLRSKAKYHIFHIPLDITVSAVLRNAMMTARENVGHLHYFTVDTALATLADSGYQVVDHFFTPSFEGLPAKTCKTKLAKLPRRVLYAISPGLMVKLLGGCSLLVLAKNSDFTQAGGVN